MSEERDVTLIGNLWTSDWRRVGQAPEDQIPRDDFHPPFDIETWTEDDAPPVVSGWPPPVPYRKENWRETDAGLRYMLIMGDTLSGMAASYLGRPERWREIWDLNSARLRPLGRSPDRLFEGDLFEMPKEAVAVAAQRGLLEELPSGDDFAKDAGVKKGIPRGLLIGGGVVAAVGVASGVTYLVMRG